MKITKALKKKAMKAMKRNEDNESDDGFDRYDEFGVEVEYINGDSVFVSTFGGPRRPIKELEWWVLYGRGEVREQPCSCTFVYKGQVLDAEKSFMDYGINDCDVLQVIIE